MALAFPGGGLNRRPKTLKHVTPTKLNLLGVSTEYGNIV